MNKKEQNNINNKIILTPKKNPQKKNNKINIIYFQEIINQLP